MEVKDDKFMNWNGRGVQIVKGKLLALENRITEGKESWVHGPFTHIYKSGEIAIGEKHYGKLNNQLFIINPSGRVTLKEFDMDRLISKLIMTRAEYDTYVQQKLEATQHSADFDQSMLESEVDNYEADSFKIENYLERFESADNFFDRNFLENRFSNRSIEIMESTTASGRSLSTRATF